VVCDERKFAISEVMGKLLYSPYHALHLSVICAPFGFGGVELLRGACDYFLMLFFASLGEPYCDHGVTTIQLEDEFLAKIGVGTGIAC
jgi:hypothetical protein